MAMRVEENATFAGTATFLGTTTIPDGTITNAKVNSGAAIASTKQQHRRNVTFNQPNTAATTETRVVAVIYGATASLKAFKAGSIAIAVGAATVTLDLQDKNGTSVLSAVITLDTGNTAHVPEAATIATAARVANDILKVIITATAGGGTLPTGVFGQLVWDEDAE